MSTEPVQPPVDGDAPDFFDDVEYSKRLGEIGVWARKTYETVRAAKAAWECYPYRTGSPGRLVATIRPREGDLSKAFAQFTPRQFAALARYSLDSGDDSIFETLRTFLSLRWRGLSMQAAAMIDERDL